MIIDLLVVVVGALGALLIKDVIDAYIRQNMVKKLMKHVENELKKEDK